MSNETVPSTAPAADDYAAWYYAHGCGKPYDVSDPRWLEFFDGIADRLIAAVGPATVLDAGCAMAILVGSFRARGVDAEGIDISEYAIRHADPRAEGRAVVGTLTEPLARRYDLITCIEVLEHIEPGEVEGVVQNLCAATDVVLLSTTPDDFNEGTHINVRPPAYWSALFAEQGFHRRFDLDCSFVSPWAVLYERRPETPRRLVHAYETVLWDLKRENRGSRLAIIKRDRDQAQLEDRLTAADAKLADAGRAADQVGQRLEEAQARLAPVTARMDQETSRARAAEDELRQTRVELAAALREVRALRGSRSYRIGRQLVAPAATARTAARKATGLSRRAKGVRRRATAVLRRLGAHRPS